MQTAVLSDVIPVLHVHDVDQSIRYYVEKLGFEVDFRYERDPDNYAGVKRGRVRLHVHRHSGEHADGNAAASNRVRVFVDDPDALLEELRSRGALDRGTTVQDTPWDTREFAFRDPDGNELAFFRMR